MNGNVTDFGNPKAEAHYKVLVHTQDFPSMVSDTSRAAGDIVLNGSLRYQNVVGQPALRNVLLEGKLESRELQVVTPQAHLPVRAIHSNYRLAGGNVEATAFTADLLGGHLMAELHMLHVDTTPAARFHADVRGVEPRGGGSVHVQHMEFSHQMAAKQVGGEGGGFHVAPGKPVVTVDRAHRQMCLRLTTCSSLLSSLPSSSTLRRAGCPTTF